MKCIKREFSVVRTPQQNGVAERKNRTLIEDARTMLAEFKIATTFWTEAVNNACYVQNRDTSNNSNSIQSIQQLERLVERTCKFNSSENAYNIAGSGPNWLFNIDALTNSMNYKPIVAGKQSNGNSGTRACDDAGKTRVEIVLGKDYILLLLWTQDLSFSSSPKNSPDDGFKPSREEEKKDTKDQGNESGNPSEGKNSKVPSTEEPRINQEKDASVFWMCLMIQNIPDLKEMQFTDAEDDGAEADMTNLDTHISASPILTSKIHKDHPVEQIIGDIHSAPQTRRMTKSCCFLWPDHAKFSCQNSREPTIKTFKIVCLHVSYHKQSPRRHYDKEQSKIGSQGNTQEEGIDYDEMDVKSAFLYEKALYGLHQAPRAWYETLSTYLLDNGFQRGKIDKTLFIRRDKGLQVKQKEDGIFISQDKYVIKILKKFGFTDVKTASTPMETQKPLLKDEDGEEVDVHLYRSLWIGSLMYLFFFKTDNYIC
ncbi:putative ribonuclease H-like domain-containing protein [Tanacetum coccineum]